MHKIITSLAICAAALFLVSCDDTEARFSGAAALTAPAPFGSEPPAISATPPFVGTQLVRNSVCPSLPPFTAGINLLVEARSANVSITQITMQFVDTFGVQVPQVTLPAPVLATQFGSALVAARSSRAFPLSFGFGCGTTRTGTIIVVVDTNDENGRHDTSQVRVRVN